MVAFRVRRFVFALLFAFGFTGYVQRTSVAIAAERMMPELGLTQVEIGWLLTAFLFTYSVFQLPGALAGQWFGPRRTLTALGLATIVRELRDRGGAVAGAAGSSLFVALLVARALLGVAQAALFPVASGSIRTGFRWEPGPRPRGRLSPVCGSAPRSPRRSSPGSCSALGWRVALIVTQRAVAAAGAALARLQPRSARGSSSASEAELAELAANPRGAPGSPVTLQRVLARARRPASSCSLPLRTSSMNYVFYLVTFWSFLYLVQERHVTVLEGGWLASLPFVVAGIASAAGGRLATACARAGAIASGCGSCRWWPCPAPRSSSSSPCPRRVPTGPSRPCAWASPASR